MIVEDGTGVVGADSYVSDTDAVSYLADRGIVLRGSPSALLYRAMDILEITRFVGVKQHEANSLSFPRTGLTDREGSDYPDSVIPVALIEAQTWLAYYIDIGNDPGKVPTAPVRRKKVDVLETEYAVLATDSTAVSITSLPLVQKRLQHLLASEGVGSRKGVLIRG